MFLKCSMYETIVLVTYKAMGARKCAKLSHFVVVIGDISYGICSTRSVNERFARCIVGQSNFT